MKSFLTRPVIAFLAVVTLAGCSPSASDPDLTDNAVVAEAVKNNNADAMFAQTMIPHHQQAVEMSRIVLEKPGLDPKVAALATRIFDAQSAEITRMSGWLEAWGEPTSHESGNHLAGPHAMTEMGDGMLTEMEMTGLATADSGDAGRRFLTHMIVHHEGAIRMARIEVDKGSNPDALAVARNVIRSQDLEISEMKELLAANPG